MTSVDARRSQMREASIEVFSTCPQSSTVPREAYLRSVVDAAQWSENSGCKGILIYTDNSLVDPWLVAQVILQNTERLCPLVAVQAVYMHPYSVATMVASLGHLYGRRTYLNMVAGGFKNDLEAFGDMTPHDRRYDRLIEYTTIIKSLLAGHGPVSYNGEFYKVDQLELRPRLPQDLFPGVFMSGSSDAGAAAARVLSATAVEYPKPVIEYEGAPRAASPSCGIRIGIITREDEGEAWGVAHERFPEDRRGQITHQLAMKTSDSSWHKQLSQLGEETETEENPYWLVPFKNYKTFCPYLVGSYDRVATELSKYISIGYTAFILDIPASEEELHHTKVVFKRAQPQGLDEGTTAALGH